MKIRSRKSQTGASTVHWLLALVPLLGFGFLAVDLNNVYLSLGELQTASDAGSLEGARLLYNPDGTINVGQNGTSAVDGATTAATANLSQGSAVEVVSVNRGHWEFRTSYQDAQGIERGGVFIANPSTTPADLVDANGDFRTFQDLNQDPNEINAVQVVTARQLTPVQAIFGRILGLNNYQTQARSVAYLGFAGRILPGELDAPIAMCEHRLRDEFGEWSCSVGRFITSSDLDEQTAGWTDFDQPEQCTGGASSSDVRDIIDCDGGVNPELLLGKAIQTIGGEVQSAFSDLYDCWRNRNDTDGDGWPDQPWSLLLPVIQCNDSNPGPCNQLIGAIAMDVLWMVDQVNVTRIDDEAPRTMGDWDGSLISDGKARWDSFVDYYDIKSAPGGSLALWQDPPGDNGYRQKTIYLSPSCEPQTPTGGTGGANFGIRAAVPVLVR
jgi:hypothetical protein